MSRPLTFGGYLKALKSFKGLAAVGGTLIPAATYFTNIAPPWWPGGAILTSALGVAVVVVAFYWRVGDGRQHDPECGMPPTVIIAVIALTLSIALGLAYIAMYHCWTVEAPETSARYQMGFGTADWTLTSDGRGYKRRGGEPTDWMNEVGWRERKFTILWKPWTITVAGLSMTIVFLASFCTWTLGWSFIAKQQAIGNAS